GQRIFVHVAAPAEFIRGRVDKKLEIFPRRDVVDRGEDRDCLRAVAADGPALVAEIVGLAIVVQVDKRHYAASFVRSSRFFSRSFSSSLSDLIGIFTSLIPSLNDFAAASPAALPSFTSRSFLSGGFSVNALRSSAAFWRISSAVLLPSNLSVVS